MQSILSIRQNHLCHVLECARSIHGLSFTKKGMNYGRDSVYAKRYFLLLIMLFNNGMSYSALFPLAGMVLPELTDARLRKEYSRLSSSGFVTSLNTAVSGEMSVYALSDAGLSELIRIGGLLDFVGDYTYPFIPEEAAALHAFNLKYSANRHRMSNLAVFSMIVSVFSGSIGIEVGIPLIEAVRGRDFVASISSKSNKASYILNNIVPDISMTLTDGYRYAPVMVETDLFTEAVSPRGSGLIEKFQNLLGYSQYNMRNYNAFPSVTLLIFCSSPKYSHAGRSGSDEFSACDYQLLSNARFSDFFRAVLMAGSLSGADLAAAEIPAFVSGMSALSLYHQSSFIRDCLSLAQKINRYYLISGRAKKNLTVSDILSVIPALRIDVGGQVREQRESMHLKNAASRRHALFERLSATSEALFENGHSIFAFSHTMFHSAVKCAFPGLLAPDAVSRLREVTGMTGEPSGTWSCRPFLSGASEYRINLRNVFRYDSTFLCIEDLTSDITSYSRIRQFLDMPSDQGKGILLVVIVPSEGLLSTGRTLDEITGPYGIFNAAYISSFRTAYGDPERLPFKYRMTNDVCFIEKERFLSGGFSVSDLFLCIGGSRIFRELPSADDRICIRYHVGSLFRDAISRIDDFSTYSY